MAASQQRVLVVGSVNVDLYQRLSPCSVTLDGKSIDVTGVKGMTLPAKSFKENATIEEQLKAADVSCEAGEAEGLLLKLAGPFEQKTGGKGANAAAAAGQSFSCELVCNFGKASAKENEMLLGDLKKYGNVDTSRAGLVDGPTGTAFIFSFPDGDNAIVLLGGANMSWPQPPLTSEGTDLRRSIQDSVCVMLQREIPAYVNVEVARCARELGKPVFMDVGGTDDPLDVDLMPYVSVAAPNESELTFISGVETQFGGKVRKSLVRAAVFALKARFLSAGNADVEVLVTLGACGSMHFAQDWKQGAPEGAEGLLPHESHVGRFKLDTPDGRPVDTTGAGDSFRGSYVAMRYGEAKGVEEAMRWAAAAGSLAVEVQGAMPSMPSREAISRRVSSEMLPVDDDFHRAVESHRPCGCGDCALQ